jgi:GNAT superfamily N-acetyltransferase
MNIRAIAADEIFAIRDLAYRIWPGTFADILSPEQIDYMLNWMYDEEMLKQQLSEGHQFFLYEQDGEALGFMGIQVFPENRVKIHKLYVLPETQGQGIGRKFIDFLKTWSEIQGINQVFLNVNRFNKAVEFYKHLGMTVLKTEDIDIGKGYWMEDFVMGMKW